MNLILDERIGQFVESAEEVEGLFDAEFSIKSQFLRHVTDSRTGNATFFRPRYATKNVHLAAIQVVSTDDTAQ